MNLPSALLLLSAVFSAVKFIDAVPASAYSLDFTLMSMNYRTSQWNYTTKHVDTGVDARLICRSNGTASTLLAIRKLNDSSRLNTSKSSEVMLTFQSVQCDSMDTYVCEDDEGHNRTIHLAIHNCQPRLCGESSNTVTRFAIAGAKISFSLCIIVYPNISNGVLLDETVINRNSEKNWSWKFASINDITHTLNVYITNISTSDYGRHTFTISGVDHGKTPMTTIISLKAPDRPECPTNFIVSKIGFDYVVLTWYPGFNGGSEQWFQVHYTTDYTDWIEYDGAVNNSWTTVNNLDRNMTYIFKVIPLNSIGNNSNCEEKRIRTEAALTTHWTSTSVVSASSSSTDSPTYTKETSSFNELVIPLVVFGGCLIAAAVICFLIYFRLKRMRHGVRRNVGNRSNKKVHQVHENRNVQAETDNSLLETESSQASTNDSGRYRSDQGLLYVSVDHEPSRPERGRNQPKRGAYQAKQTKEKVEYTTLAFNDTGTQEKSEKLYANV